MLATLLIIRQFLQNVKEVLQPYLYEHQKLREFTLRTLWEVLQTSICKYGRVALGKAWMTGEALSKDEKSDSTGQPEKKGRKSLLAGFRNTQAEEGEEENALKHRKVSFTKKVQYKDSASNTKVGHCVLQDGSPTLVEEGADPANIFEICDNDSDSEILESSKDAARFSNPVPLLSEPKPNVVLPPREKMNDTSEMVSKKISWIDPPDEKELSTLTQPEIESCMLTYEVCLQRS